MYRTVDTSFWTDPKVLALPSSGKLFLAYLITNPHSHVSGIYYLPALLAEHETGLSKRALDTLRHTLSEARLAFFDGPLSVVWVRRMFFYQGRGEKNERAAAAQLRNLHGSKLIEGFLREYASVARWCNGYPIGRVSEGGTPDQDQDQDQDQESSPTLSSTSVPIVDSSSDPDACASDDGPLPIQSPIPVVLETSDFLAAWQEFRVWRLREKHKRMTETAEKRTLADLAPYGPVVAVAALQLSMRNDWQGVFPEKVAGNGARNGGKPQRRLDGIDDSRREGLAARAQEWTPPDQERKV